jgi:hypothetical protein
MLRRIGWRQTFEDDVERQAELLGRKDLILWTQGPVGSHGVRVRLCLWGFQAGRLWL